MPTANSWQGQADGLTPSEKAGDAAGYHGVLYGAFLVDIPCGQASPRPPMCQDVLTPSKQQPSLGSAPICQREVGA